MYLALLNDNTIYMHKYLWKMKVLLKYIFSCGSCNGRRFKLRIIFRKETGMIVKSVVL
jgi:hypothetical protein